MDKIKVDRLHFVASLRFIASLLEHQNKKNHTVDALELYILFCFSSLPDGLEIHGRTKKSTWLLT